MSENNEIMANVDAAQDAKPASVKSEAISSSSVEKKAHKRYLVGKVKSNKSDKTIVFSIETQVRHPLYKKYYKKTKSFMAHDENNECKMGDIVKVKESRPLSARKRWILVEILERAK